MNPQAPEAAAIGSSITSGVLTMIDEGTSVDPRIHARNSIPEFIVVRPRDCPNGYDGKTVASTNV